MTRYVIDATVALHLLSEGAEPSPDHQVLAPTLIRSEVLNALYRAVRGGDLSEEAALERLARFATMKIRYLGDRVLRRRAWSVAGRLGRDSTTAAEYVALTQLQADAFVTLDEELAAAAAAEVELAPIEAIL